MNTDDALLFVRLAESLSFKDAAKELSISRSAASKRIAQLEKELGVTLISRNPRKSTLTRAGLLVLERCRAICASVEDARQIADVHRRLSAGPLHVAIQAPLGGCLLPVLLGDFVSQFPKTNLSVDLVDAQIDIVGGRYDVALTMSRKLADSSLKAQRIATSRQVLVASPAYLGSHGTPNDPRELSRHRCLGIGHAATSSGRWQFKGENGLFFVKIRYAMTSNNYHVLNCAACLDMGFLYVPELFVRREIAQGTLSVVLMPNLSSIDWGLYAMFHARYASQNVRAFINFIKARIEHLGQTESVQA